MSFIIEHCSDSVWGIASVSVCCVVEEEAIWKRVLAMQDPVKVDYGLIEQLFCQKRMEKSPDQAREKKQHSTEVFEDGSRPFYNVLYLQKISTTLPIPMSSEACAVGLDPM